MNHAILDTWFTNLLYDKNVFDELKNKPILEEESHLLHHWLTTHYVPEHLIKLNEAQLERHFIEPIIKQFLICFLDILGIEGDIAHTKDIKQIENLKLDVFFGAEAYPHDQEKAKNLRLLFEEMDEIQQRFNFFHYDVVFPEARQGFDVIVGNPPWDKTKFADTDFFPFYKSRYRSLSAGEKRLFVIIC